MNEQNAGKAGIITVQMGAVISQLLHVYRPLGKGLPIKSHEIGLIMAISHFRQERQVWPSPSDLSLLMDVTRPAITASLNSLEQQGYVYRRVSSTDRRRCVVELSDNGKDLVHTMFAQFYANTQKLVDALGEEESRLLITLLQKALVPLLPEKGVVSVPCEKSSNI